MTPDLLFFDKAVRAYRLACAAVDLADWDGVANRSYYAMFNAARAAILASGVQVKWDFARTHSGLISVLNEHLIKNNKLSKDIGRLLAQAQETRLMADYKDETVSESDAKVVLSDAVVFLEAVREKYFPSMSGEISAVAGVTACPES